MQEKNTQETRGSRTSPGGFGYKAVFAVARERSQTSAGCAPVAWPNARPWIVALATPKDIATSSGPLLEKYGVDIYFAGLPIVTHDRGLPQRQVLSRQTMITCKSRARLWVVAGGAGSMRCLKARRPRMMITCLTEMCLQKGPT